MGIRIVKFKKGDERKLANLCKKSIEGIKRKDLKKKQADFLVHEFSSRGVLRYSRLATVYIAKKKEKYVGTITLFNNQIKGMFVLPEEQSLGVGSKLLEYAEEIANKKGYDFTFSNVGLFAEKFYKKFGYKKVKNVDTILGTLLLMKKKLQ